jgi:hypothetical protein
MLAGKPTGVPSLPRANRPSGWKYGWEKSLKLKKDWRLRANPLKSLWRPQGVSSFTRVRISASDNIGKPLNFLSKRGFRDLRHFSIFRRR